MSLPTSLTDKLPVVLQLYLDDTRNQLKTIERILAVQRDMAPILLAAHSIRASSAHMGVRRMIEAANALEAAAHEKSKDEAQQDLLFMLTQIKSIFAETEQMLRSHTEPELAF